MPGARGAAGPVSVGKDGPVTPDLDHDALMQIALAQARQALVSQDVPVGAAVVNRDGVVIGTGRNRREADGDPTAHAEMLAIREAAVALGQWRLEGCTLVVTLEPCLMCAGALLQGHISRVVFGAWDDKAGAAGSMYDVVRDRRLPHRAEVVGGVRADAASDLLRAFFRDRR